MIDAAGVIKRIKETAVVVADPDRELSEPSLVMPANEDTSSDDFVVLTRIKPGRTNPPAGTQAKMPGTDESSSSPVLSSFTASTEERKGFEKGDFRSMPYRNVHEKLFRDFFELVLQRAVFQVCM